MIEIYATAFATLFVMIDPIGVAPLFATLTQGASLRQRMAIALRGVLIGGALLLIFGLIGDAALSAVGISVPAFRIAGGLMLFLLAVDMLFEKRGQRRQQHADAEAEANDPSVFPLATPLIAGPGALTAMVLLAADVKGDPAGSFVVYGALLTILLITFLFLIATDLIERALGDTGIKVLTRLFGMMLGALAVQFVLDGVEGYMTTL
ncbi:MarC family protein [Pikeienuella piscinae]|uniref:UPF0056 membrane protein n=1 Tax=Pikeienuella piscinae TaxID=2748098 RepID=A0A7L5BUD1_9RHOB|nr:MarC family protein [Pikeienuella piscinae]QIE54583.1 MarC family protein [Pikeienuella piscinae]